MALSKTPYKGTRDFFPKEKRELDYIFKKMRETAELFGYEPYDGPLLEEVELYKAKSGEELINDQIYSFTDRGERFVAIRPEMTPTVARMVAQIHREAAKPIRFYAIPNLMRYEKPQKGRLREHWQFNCDIFGSPGREGEIEILQLAVNLMKSFGATEKNFEILINDRAIVEETFKKRMGLTDEVAYKLYKIVDKAKKVPRDALVEMVEKLGMSKESEKIFYQYIELKNFDELFEFASVDSFKNFVESAKEVGLLPYLVYDPTIVRGLDYYTGVVFEIFDKHPENRRAICGGGAYANLLQIFNEPALNGVGFGLGDVTLKDFLITHALLPDFKTPVNDLLLTFQSDKAKGKALALASELRNRGVKVISELAPVKFNKVFSIAEKKGASFVSFMDERELESGSIQIKNMKTKEQEDFAITAIDQITELLKSRK